MAIIQSGLIEDQLYYGMLTRLARQSNNARDNFPAGVNPQVKEIIDRMHSIMPAALASLEWGVLPDMYGVSGPNAINKMGGITAAGGATQGTAENRPTLSEPGDRMNLLTRSRFEGTLGDGNNPTGYSGIGGVDGGTVNFAGLVESDDDSNGHQAFRTDLTSARYRLQRTAPVLEGQELLAAVFMEYDGYVSGDRRFLLIAGSQSLVDSDMEVDGTRSGEWMWSTIDATEDGTVDFRIGISAPGNNNHATGNFRFSRPCLIDRPPDWASKSSAEKQQYLTDHYAATSELQKFAGYRGMRVAKMGESHALAGPNPNLQANGGGSFALFIKITDGRSLIRRLWTASSGFRHGALLESGGSVRFDFRDASDNSVPYRVRSSAWELGKWHLVSVTTKIGEKNKLYIDGVQVDEANSVQPHYFPTSLLNINSAGATGWSDFSLAAFIHGSPDWTSQDHANLNAILRGEAI